MFRKDRLSAFGEQAGFTVTVESDVVRAIRVPCLLAGGLVGTCTIEKSYDPASGKPSARIGDAVHAVTITTEAGQDGRVYHADGSPLESYIAGDGRTWSTISIRKGSQGSPEEDESASDLIHRYAKQIVGAVSAAGYSETSSLTIRTPFKIPNTFEARARDRPGSGSNPPSADRDHWPRGHGRIHSRPCSQDTRDGNPSSGFRRRRVAQLYAGARLSHCRGG